MKKRLLLLGAGRRHLRRRAACAALGTSE